MKKPSIKINLIYSTLYQILIVIVPLITAPYTSRIFGADGVGIQSYTNSVVAYFTMFAALGTASYGQRTIARVRDDKKKASKAFWEIEILSIITTFISMLVWTIIIVTGGEYRPYYAILSMSVIAVAFDISWFFGGYEQFQFIFIRNAVIRLVGMICLFAFVKSKDDLLLYMALLAVSGLLGNISMWTYLPKFLVKIEWKSIKLLPHFKETLLYFIPTIATSIYNVADKTMLGILTSDTYEVGYYEQANKIANMAKTVLFSLNTVMTSRMSYLFKNGTKNEFDSMLKKSMNASLFLSIPLFFGISAISKSFVPLFFGEGYDKVELLLPLCSTMIVIIGISNCMERQYFTPSGRKRLSNNFVIIGAIINFCLNMLLIPRFKSTGATVASIIAECFISGLYLFFARKELALAFTFRLSLKYVISGCVMFLGVRVVDLVLPTNWPGIIAEVGIGAVIYFVVLYIEKDEFFVNCIRQYVVPVFKKK